MKKRIVFICFFLFSLLINVIPLFVFKDKVAFSVLSIYPVLFMSAVTLRGIIAYCLRRKRNYLSFAARRIDFCEEDQDFTFTEEYCREFYWQFIVYWFSIPFFVPCIVFCTMLFHCLWAVCVVFVPQIVYLINDIVKGMQERKEILKEKQKREQELKKQKEREELGYYK